MKNKTLIEKQLEKKTNPELVKTIIEAKKKKNWLEVAAMLSSPRAKRINMNLDKINDEAKEGEIVVCSMATFSCFLQESLPFWFQSCGSLTKL